MYFAIISKRYDPNAFVQPKESRGICFSRWHFEKDWTLTIKTVTNSETYPTGPGSLAIDGFYAQGSNYFASFSSGLDSTHPWILVRSFKLS